MRKFDIEKFIAGLHDYIGRALRPLSEVQQTLMARVKAIEDRGPPQDGKDGTSVTLDDVAPLVRQFVDEIPKPQDGKSVTIDEIRPLVDELKPEFKTFIVGEIGASFETLPKPENGKDGISPDSKEIEKQVVAVMEDRLSNGLVELRELIENYVKTIKPEDGKDGTSVTIDDIRPVLKELVDALPTPKDGKDGKDGTTLEEIELLVASLVKAAVDALPPPKDGKDGTNVTLPEVMAELTPVIQQYIDAIPRPKDGKDCDQEAVLRACRDLTESEITNMRSSFASEIAQYLDEIPKPQDGKSVDIKDVERMLEDRVNGWALDFERRAQDLVQKMIDRIPQPKDGKDGFGFDDLDVRWTGKRTIGMFFKQGERSRDFEIKFPGMLYDEDVYERGKSYEFGDCVTWGGSYWSARKDTSLEPGANNNDWRLVSKRGRDGKDGELKKPRDERPVVKVGGAK